MSTHLDSSKPEKAVRTTLDRFRHGDSPAVGALLDDISFDAVVSMSEKKRFAFWINGYNLAVQHLLHETSKGPTDPGFFDQPITIAGQQLSLNDIEHGILRKRQKSKLKYEPFASVDLLSQLEVQELDPRIHFALNCGARSCPPVVVYNPSQLDPQLNAAVDRYLQAETKFDEQTETVTIPAVFDWFEGDFGGRPGVIQFLRSHGAIPKDFSPVIKYRGWDWESVPRNFL
ncbi:DUF547 domain-containing protein [Salinarchaeum sp. IM2453]|uniref:DUF547 domain-containing protein n=1 Tax=Salinarchaeum sp. IM2453 TaxID=2862870 RepID=UPI001C82C301|nr:DUF547 domain-containing protein [Salinarchaeum sp. IM2453]QZA88379.1 DUF547 domain-containing protein [Salinarchaeum sp. IM2453]